MAMMSYGGGCEAGCCGTCERSCPNNYCVHRANWAQVPCALMKMSCSPFVRLFNGSGPRKLVRKLSDPCVPKDSLDLALTSCYDHHRQFWVPKASVKRQCPTYGLFPWGRAQRKMAQIQCYDCCNPYTGHDRMCCCE